jgi:subtilisin family serine protease
MAKKNYRCRLLPFERTDCLSIQEAKQKSGWNITAFDLPKAWEHTQGEGVVIAVLDTGCDLTHEDLKNNLLPGMNFCNTRKPPIDGNGHGTHITGTLVAENNNIGVVGVCPHAKVRPVKVLDDKGNGDMRKVADGIRWAIDQRVDLISMSLGAPIKVQEVRKAIQAAAKEGIVTFVAAGNAGNTKEVLYPANYPETIAIGAIDENFRRANFSNTGDNLDFMAPGVDIFSTVPTNWYATLSGTSMAQPFACGVAALLLSYVKSGKTNIKQFYQGFVIIDVIKFMKATKDHPIVS